MATSAIDAREDGTIKGSNNELDVLQWFQTMATLTKQVHCFLLGKNCFNAVTALCHPSPVGI